MDILDRFIEQAKENLESGYYELSNTIDSNNERISLKQKLANQDFSLVAEIKHASPAGEYSFDYIDVEKIAFTFKHAGADALSVVVEPKIFKGDLSNVPLVKKAALPVLFKDFILDAKQITAASKLGADCVLLIVKLAERLGLDINELIRTAHSCNLEVLLEVYNKREMRVAMQTGADILGINNRDLQTLHIDITRTKEIMQYFNNTNLNTPVLSESGIKSREDARFVKAAGVKGILVGTALWKAVNQFEKIKELRIR